MGKESSGPAADDGDDAVEISISHSRAGRGHKGTIYPKLLKAEMGKEGLGGGKASADESAENKESGKPEAQEKNYRDEAEGLYG